MAEHTEDEGYLEPTEELDESKPSIDAVLEVMQGRVQETPPPARSPEARTLMGEVTEETTVERPDRVMVRWRDEDDEIHERPLRFLAGLKLRGGDKVLLSKPGNWPGWIVTGSLQHGAPAENVQELDIEELKEALDIKVEGRRLEIEGQDEVVIRCGKSSITLRRNGRVVIRGTYVESRSKGTNRIKGGSVQIN